MRLTRCGDIKSPNRRGKCWQGYESCPASSVQPPNVVQLHAKPAQSPMAEELGSEIRLLAAKIPCSELQVGCGMLRGQLEKVQYPSLKRFGCYIFFFFVEPALSSPLSMHLQPRGSFSAADRAPPRNNGRRSATEPSMSGGSYSVGSFPTSMAPRGLSGDFNQLLSPANPGSHSFGPEIVGVSLDNSQVGASYIRDYSAPRNSSEGTWGLLASNDLSRPGTQALQSGPGQGSPEFNSGLPQSGLQGGIFRGEDVR
jgi:hypothetical protein